MNLHEFGAYTNLVVCV